MQLAGAAHPVAASLCSTAATGASRSGRKRLAMDPWGP
ncbi:hypothetical protein C4K39_0203 [Pseudomonas sessilinigenes]|nr:hypothetical protein C4K39_0203 [Pseudomonas sessilinigenes]